MRRGWEIADIISVANKELVFKITSKEKGTQKILLAFDRKRITENDFKKANKYAEENNLRYTLLCKGEPTKKIQSFIDAIKNLSEIEQFE